MSSCIRLVLPSFGYFSIFLGRVTMGISKLGGTEGKVYQKGLKNSPSSILAKISISGIISTIRVPMRVLYETTKKESIHAEHRQENCTA